MKFYPLPLSGAFLIELESVCDDRGYFSRIFCREELNAKGLHTEIAQVNTSFSQLSGTLRGMHYQLPPAAEDKILRCERGKIYDVIIDIRPESPTFGEWHAEILADRDLKLIYVPKGFAHGFYTLESNTQVTYLVTHPYVVHLERGIRWNDPHFRIEWPGEPAKISSRDQSHPDFDPAYHLNPDNRL